MKANLKKDNQLVLHSGVNLAHAKREIENALYELPYVESVDFAGWRKSYSVTIGYGQMANGNDLAERAPKIINETLQHLADRPKLKEYWDKLREWWNNYYITNREVALIVIIDIILTLLK